MKFKRGDLIEFEWVDPSTHAGHQASPESLPCVLAKTVGYFVNTDRHYLRVCHTTYGANGDADVTVVPLALLIGKPKKK